MKPHYLASTLRTGVHTHTPKAQLAGDSASPTTSLCCARKTYRGAWLACEAPAALEAPADASVRGRPAAVAAGLPAATAREGGAVVVPIADDVADGAESAVGDEGRGDDDHGCTAHVARPAQR
eukprot:CAMPEP_0185317940 /NCGR_PEP_ID=MMETSP1363-20130426/48122_1 /TAXON_ID=38817 /ORGANISM="Gephyrocapsa oceanica, Strain RCC1303" /LENGTH=122 /DNA_ID=CAMNT_0027916205 /DNA_START=102 /DNA_END=469 /DNA_ORIENTATION=+